MTKHGQHLEKQKQNKILQIHYEHKQINTFSNLTTRGIKEMRSKYRNATASTQQKSHRTKKLLNNMNFTYLLPFSV